MKFNFLYYRNLMIINAFGSAHIEGNRLSFNTTKEIISNNFNEEQIIHSIKSIYPNLSDNELGKEVNEIVGFRRISTPFTNSLTKLEPLTPFLIRSFHESLMYGIPNIIKGSYRIQPNFITNVHVETSPANEIQNDLTMMIENYNKKINKPNLSIIESIEALAYLHLAFETIHPFSDGNGRTGRIMITYESIKLGLPPLIISEEDRFSYYVALSNGNDVPKPNIKYNDFESKINFKKLEYLTMLFAEKILEELYSLTTDKKIEYENKRLVELKKLENRKSNWVLDGKNNNAFNNISYENIQNSIRLLDSKIKDFKEEYFDFPLIEEKSLSIVSNELQTYINENMHLHLDNDECRMFMESKLEERKDIANN